MPRLTRWYLKTALAYFVVALLTGALLAARPLLDLPVVLVALQPTYFHLLMVGWVTQLIFGVVFWMFPKYSAERPRGSEALGWVSYGLLNAGLLLRAVGEPWAGIQPSALAGAMLAVSGLFQAMASWAFVANTWARVRER